MSLTSYQLGLELSEDSEEDCDYDGLCGDLSSMLSAKPMPSRPCQALPSTDQEAGADDGWDSDVETPAEPPPEASASAYSYLLRYDDGTWVDEAMAIFASDKDTTRLQSVLREMFSLHRDVRSLLLAFVRRASKQRMNKRAVPRLSLKVFQEWLGERKESGDDISNAVLTAAHQTDALELLFSCHPVMVDLVYSAFELRQADRQTQLFLVESLLQSGRFKEAATYTWKFELHEHFSMEEMLLPLIATNKINVIENYISDKKELQEQFLFLLDRLCTPGTNYKHLSSCLAAHGASPKNGEVDSKLSANQLHKLGLRLIRMFNLELDKFPNISERRCSNCLHHLLRKKYVEGAITDDNTDELIMAAVQSRSHLQFQLIAELVRFGDFDAAARWATRLSIAVENVPLSLHPHLQARSARSLEAHSSQHCDDKFYQFPLPLERVYFVEDEATLQNCLRTLTQPDVIIGIDAEWRLPACNGGIERMALLQLATADLVFLVDIVNLPQRTSEHFLRQFISDIFGVYNSLKLGYGVDGDLSLLARSWPFAADILACPKRTVDLRVLSRMLQLLQPVTSSDMEDCHLRQELDALPAHPLLREAKQPASISEASPKTATGSPTRAKPCPLARVVNEPQVEENPDAKRRGLSSLVMAYLGKPLDKSQQLSDWEKRPLRTEQVKYAALDAHCLLAIYKHLAAQALAIDSMFNVEPSVGRIKVSKRTFRKPSHTDAESENKKP